MDSERFDGLVRTFGQIGSRRQTLRALAGLIAGGLVALTGWGDAAAGQRCAGNADCPKCQYCRSTGRCARCAGACDVAPFCRPDQVCPGASCTAHEQCCGGVCNGLGQCQFGGCIDIGSCEATADCCVGRVCVGGECGPAS